MACKMYFETVDMRLSTGEIIYTDPLNADTDGDGLKDGEEIIPQFKFVDSSSIGLPGGSCGICFNMVSDPTMGDSDEDGISDIEDTAVSEKGVGNGIIGKLTIVSSNNNGIWDGHSFLVYESYIDDYIDLPELYGGFEYVYSTIDDTYGLTKVNELDNYRYHIRRNHYITLGSAARNSENILDAFFKSISNQYIEGGSWFNWEANKAYEGTTYDDNYAISAVITYEQLNTVISFFGGENNYYNALFHNCTFMAASAWNLAVNDNLSSIDYTLMCFTPKELKNSIYERADHFEFDLAKMLRWERNL